MPTIRVELFEGRTPQQKADLAREFTEACVRPSDFVIVSTSTFASEKRRKRRTSSSVHRKRVFLAVIYY